MTPANIRTFNIPELTDLLASYLSPADLLACVQVNSQWNEYFIPWLWHTIDDRLQSWEQILLTNHSDPNERHTKAEMKRFTPSTITDGKDEDWMRGIFRRYGQHIRVLKLHWVILVDVASTSGVCTNLKDLEMDLLWPNGEDLYWSRKLQASESGTAAPPEQETLFEMEGVFEPPKMPSNPFTKSPPLENLGMLKEGLLFTQLFWSLVRSNLGLQRLHLLHYAVNQLTVKSREFVYEILSGMKDLKEFCIPEILDLSYVLGMNKLAPTLETVMFTRVTPLSKTDTMNANSSIKTLRYIRRCPDARGGIFGLPRKYETHRMEDVLESLSVLPNLERLDLVHFVVSSKTRLFSLPMPRIPTFPAQSFGLKELHVPNGRSTPHLLPLFPNLRVIEVQDMSGEALKVLANECKHLEVLVWKGYPSHLERDSGTHGLHQFLASCQSLKVFDGIELFIRADDIAREPWACQRIETLRCKITGVERMTGLEELVFGDTPLDDYEGISESLNKLLNRHRVAAKKRDRSLKQQKLVYERLASLKHLKHLELGFDYYNSAFENPLYTPDTLEFSLESGLDLLDTLKDLEIFGCGMDHRIQKPELDWMAKSWPKLKVIHGLTASRLGKAEHDETKAEVEKLREYMQALRPNIKLGTT